MASSAADRREVKAVLLGATGVGKSSLVLRFCNDSFDPFSESTLGASFMSKVVDAPARDGEDGDGKAPPGQIKYQIWDTAGQEQYAALTRMYYRGAAVAVIVYDITRKDSFESVGKTWVEELRRQGPPNIVIAIVGNKSDLAAKREVTKEEALAYATKINAVFVETSAKTAQNVSLLFEEIAKLLPDPPSDDDDDSDAGGRPLSLSDPNQKHDDREGCAC